MLGRSLFRSPRLFSSSVLSKTNASASLFSNALIVSQQCYNHSQSHHWAHLKSKRKKIQTFFNVPTSIQNSSAEEAVNNILYNTPPAPKTPVQRHILNILVSNEPGVLSRISGVLAARNFNIESLVVAKTDVPDLSRMTVAIYGQYDTIEQAKRQLEDMVPVWAVLDYTLSKVVQRELVLVKVSTVPHEHFTGDEDDHSKVSTSPASTGLSPLLGSSVQRQAICDLTALFHGKVVDVALESVVVEVTAKPERIDAFLKILKPYGIIEATRSGTMAMPRSPLDHVDDDADALEVDDDSGKVDASQLPPG